MTSYKATGENWVIRVHDSARISTVDSAESPNNNDNYIEYKTWVEAGGVVEPADPPTEDDLREQFKVARANAVSRITVTTQAGNTFDGDEISQGRMARAILGLQAAGAGAVVSWVLADNSVIMASAAELLEALTLSGLEQAQVWVQQP